MISYNSVNILELRDQNYEEFLSKMKTNESISEFNST